MAKPVTRYDVFISSPSDVVQEREAIQEAIEQINQIRGRKEGFQLVAVMWEKDVGSQIGSAPQDVINEQIGDDYDIFVGVLCSRFGQKTTNYDSGTEEEFFRAYDRKKASGDNVEILFYFKDPRQANEKIDASQLLKVAEFKEQISNLGVYTEFESTENLKTKVVAGITAAVDRLISNSGSSQTEDPIGSDKKTGTFEPSHEIIKISDFDEDIGLVELSEIVYDALDKLTATLNVIVNATEKLGQRMQLRADQIERGGRGNSDQWLRWIA